MDPIAHAEECTRRPDRPAGAFIAAALVVAALGTAHAATLGDIELRSYLGEQFDARIPLSANEGESLDLACFSLVAPESEGAAVTRAQLSVESEGGKTSLRILSNRPWNEPVANIRVRLFCARTGPVIRDLTTVIDAVKAAEKDKRTSDKEIDAIRTKLRQIQSVSI